MVLDNVLDYGLKTSYVSCARSPSDSRNPSNYPEAYATVASRLRCRPNHEDLCLPPNISTNKPYPGIFYEKCHIAYPHTKNIMNSESQVSGLQYDLYTKKNDIYSGTFVAYESVSSDLSHQHSGNAPLKVSDIYKLLNYEEADRDMTKRTIPLSGDEYPVISSRHISRHLSSPQYTTKSYYHPYLGSSFHPRAVSYITSATPQHYLHHTEYPYTYLYRNQYIDTKNHPCQYPGCYMRFKRLEHLKRHFRVHTLERPYICTQEGCDKTFSRRDNLGQHLKTHERRAQKQKHHSKSAISTTK